MNRNILTIALATMLLPAWVMAQFAPQYTALPAAQVALPGSPATLGGLIECCDIDGDGLDDVITPIAGTTPSLGVTLSRPNGVPSSYGVISFPAGAGAVTDICCTDVDGDGVQDIISVHAIPAGMPGAATTYLTTLAWDAFSFPFFSATSTVVDAQQDVAIECCDLDDDGLDDLLSIAANGATTVRPGIVGGFGASGPLVLPGFGTPITVTPAAGDILCCDIDFDGLEDVVVWTATGVIQFGMGVGGLPGVAQSTIPTIFPGVPLLDVECCDANQDGLLDLVYVGTGAGIFLRRGVTLPSGVSFATVSDAVAAGLVTATDVCCVDADGDGLDEMATSFAGGVSFYQMIAGMPPTISVATIPSTVLSASIACCDLDGDGDEDIALAGASLDYLLNDLVAPTAPYPSGNPAGSPNDFQLGSSIDGGMTFQSGPVWDARISPPGVATIMSAFSPNQSVTNFAYVLDVGVAAAPTAQNDALDSRPIAAAPSCFGIWRYGNDAVTNPCAAFFTYTDPFSGAPLAPSNVNTFTLVPSSMAVAGLSVLVTAISADSPNNTTQTVEILF